MNTPEHRDTPATFAPEEAAAVRRMVSTPGAPLKCPRCGGELHIGTPMGGGSIGEFWEVSCPTCHRVLLVGDVPRPRRPSLGA